MRDVIVWEQLETNGSENHKDDAVEKRSTAKNTTHRFRTYERADTNARTHTHRYRHTHTQTHTHTNTHTDTDTHTQINARARTHAHNT